MPIAIHIEIENDFARFFGGYLYGTERLDCHFHCLLESVFRNVMEYAFNAGFALARV
jgi:hypothetical protein